MEQSTGSRPRGNWLVLVFGAVLIVIALVLAILELALQQNLASGWVLLVGLGVFLLGVRLKGARG